VQLLSALATVLLGGCARPAPPSAAAPASAAPADSTVVARVAGGTIGAAEVDAQAAAKLMALRQQEYDARRAALDELIEKRLFEQEAQKRGVTVDALLAEEVAKKSPAPDPRQVEALYAQNRAQLQGRPFEAVRGQIEEYLRGQAQAQRRQAFRAELEARAAVQVLLKPPRYEIPVPATAPTQGPAGAPVTLVSFADYQCPFCQRAEQVVAELERRYTGKLRLVHRDFPLDFHPRARIAARASYCAGEQGRFWEYHRGLLLQPSDYGDADLAARARALGLQEAPFTACVASDRFDAVIAQGLEDGSKLGVNSTPTFFINGRMVSGARSLEQFAQVIDEELAAANAGS
jgi:protein-disulfide isomerase